VIGAVPICGTNLFMYKCKFCEKEFEKNNLVAGHVRWCNLNPNRVKKKIKPSKKIGGKKFIHSEAAKKIISEKRKAWLAANKDKHNWSRYTNKESVPEKNFREFVEKTDIKLVQYYTPPESDRFFEIDFAEPNKKIGFEINGNQHYNSDGTLTEYFQNRRDHFINLGWNIVEVHYALCFKEEQIKEILTLAFSDFSKCEEKVQEIANDRLARKNKKIEEQKKTFVKVDWLVEPVTEKQLERFISSRKVERPSKEELSKMLQEIPTLQIAKKYGVADNTVAKWAKRYGLSKPPRGYWSKGNLFGASLKHHLNMMEKDKPTKEELEKLVWEMSIESISRLYKINADTISRWIKKWEISKPPIGHWSRQRSIKK
jgi:hypothetical protein